MIKGLRLGIHFLLVVRSFILLFSFDSCFFFSGFLFGRGEGERGGGEVGWFTSWRKGMRQADIRYNYMNSRVRVRRSIPLVLPHGGVVRSSDAFAEEDGSELCSGYWICVSFLVPFLSHFLPSIVPSSLCLRNLSLW